ncbi:alpha/beta hydrolase [Pseudomonas sp. PCH199]|uniref:alpha/beta hydrolase n=1 Tax=unclassified Pseudomonas TaxID=196821 RepID=UPI000BCE7B87|nr:MULTISPECIES: alpha/beta hydrolase [unclassified Pseudomonas]MCW8277804.1 alpha/beta hydrolase [Pseudomonas sp. PCH199]PAM81965.1 esterase [Pseudomonas sp. ERMR1:02]
MALDAASLALLGQLAEQGVKPFHKMDVFQSRSIMSSLRDLLGTGPAMHRIEEVVLGQGKERIRVRVLFPDVLSKGTIIYYHGGGWTLMSIDDYDSLGRFIAAETGCTVILVDYRLAPEHPYPAAVDDAWLALTWADAQRSALTGSSDTPLIVMGDSAGGTLAAVIAQKSRDEGGPKLAQQVLVYPVTQPDLNTPGYLDPLNQGLLGKEDMAWFWDQYLPNVHLRKDPQASPLLATSLKGLPPAILITAEHDILRDEGEAYALALMSAGVMVQRRCFEGQIHGFFTLLNLLPESATARAFVVQAIKKISKAMSIKQPRCIGKNKI